jgi:hypothetical protein
MGIEEIRIASKSPWQNCYVERVIGTIRLFVTENLSMANS